MSASSALPLLRSPCASMDPISFTAAIARRWRRWDLGIERCGAFRQMPNCASTLQRCARPLPRIAAMGFRPACVIGTAGTVNTGAIDDLQGLARLAKEEDLWFHVDGCVGALIAVAPNNAYRVSGIESADSIALDPHKWLHEPFEAGCDLIRDASAHRGSFAVSPEYLETAPRGLASGQWLYDYGLQTTRGFKALKIWMAVKQHGIEKFGRLIDQNIAQGHYLGTLIEAEPSLELVAPTNINIVCYRYRHDGKNQEELKALNTEIMLRLQENGTAVVSDTTIQGEHCLRVAINNHRTRREDLQLLVRETLRIGDRLVKDKPDLTA